MTIGQLEQELGRNATETEVAERLGIDIADYRQMLLDTKLFFILQFSWQ